MQFDRENDKGEKYALLYPKFEENEVLKKAADEVGASNALRYDRDEKAYRLFEAKVPEKVDVDKVFGRFATEEAKAASVAERDEVSAKKKSAARATGAEVDESRIYYPAVGNGDREAFTKMRQETGAQFFYSSRHAGFVHKDGPTEGFERFQTPEAKEAWAAESGKVKEASRSRREKAAEGIDVMAERANGRVFLADNAQGFLLPSKSQTEARDAQMATLKSASSEEVAQVYRITEAAKGALDRKLYGIQLTAAKENGVEKDDFDKMKSEDRRVAANYKGLQKEDFSKLTALTGGFFAIRNEMVDRGLLQTRESARDLQKEGKGAAAGAGNAMGGPKADKPKEQAEKKKGKGMAAQLQAGAAAQGVGR